MTPYDLISLALKQAGVLGVGQAASAEDMNDAFSLLNMMLSQWNQRRWLIYHLVDVSAVSTGSDTFTVGPLGQFPSARPDRVEAAFARLLAADPSNQFDIPLAVIESREDFNRIALKNQIGLPSAIFYDATFPIGTLHVWPVPAAGQYEIHITLKAVLGVLANLKDTVALPDAYQEALLYNLTVRLFSHFQRPIRADVMALAKASLNTIRGSNTAISTFRMPSALAAPHYNVYGDFYQ